LSDRRCGSYCIGHSEKAKHDRRSSMNKQQVDRQYCSLNPAENHARQSAQNEVPSSTLIVMIWRRLLVRISIEPRWQQRGSRSRMLPLRSAKQYFLRSTTEGTLERYSYRFLRHVACSLARLSFGLESDQKLIWSIIIFLHYSGVANCNTTPAVLRISH
jgi:hypothetical protein